MGRFSSQASQEFHFLGASALLNGSLGGIGEFHQFSIQGSRIGLEIYFGGLCRHILSDLVSSVLEVGGFRISIRGGLPAGDAKNSETLCSATSSRRVLVDGGSDHLLGGRVGVTGSQYLFDFAVDVSESRNGDADHGAGQWTQATGH